MPTRAALLLALLLLSLTSQQSHAAWPIRADLPGVTVSTIGVSERVKGTVSDGRGGAILLIESLRSGANGFYAQRVDAGGTPIWATHGVRLSFLGDFPQMISDGLGGAIAVWRDDTNGIANSDIRAQRIDSLGVIKWGADGVLVCAQTSDQTLGDIASDGAGGVVVSFYDDRNAGTTGNDVYAQRLSSSGTRQWGTTGLAVVSRSGSQFADGLVATADGGTFVVCHVYDGIPYLFAKRLDINGTSVWGEKVLFYSVGSQYYEGACASADGFIVVAMDDRSGTSTDVYAQRVTGAGTILWGSLGAGAAVLTSSIDESADGVFSDGAGGVLVGAKNNAISLYDHVAQRVNVNGTREWGSAGLNVAFGHTINSAFGWAATTTGALILGASPLGVGNSYEAEAWRVDGRGVLGNPSPVITRVSDVLADQGGQVAVQWSASTHDVEPDRKIAQYTLWREVPAALAAMPVRATVRPLRVQRLAAQTLYWEYVATMPARARAGYSAVVATTTDSMPGSNLATAFMVSAETSSGADYWDSAPTNGYSVDNLAPAAPAPFAGQYAPGGTALHWNRNSETDLAGYHLYRGTTPLFALNAGSLVAALPDTGYVDAAAQPYYYRLTAVDLHGNESPAAFLQPSGVLDVGDDPGLRAQFAMPRPNPVRAGVGTTLRFSLAQAGDVRLILHDVQGRAVRTLAEGGHEAGEHTVPFDGRGAGGRRLAPGLYLARIDAPGLRATQRLVIIP